MSDDCCIRCREIMSLRDGCDPTPECDNCAHELLTEARAEIESLREGLARIQTCLTPPTTLLDRAYDIARALLSKQGEPAASASIRPDEVRYPPVPCDGCGGDGLGLCLSCNNGGVDGSGGDCATCHAGARPPKCPTCKGTGAKP